jgi:hypothetical protein
MQSTEETAVRRHPTISGLAMIATAVAVPVLVSVYRRSRTRDYTRTREFRALVDDYVI